MSAHPIWSDERKAYFQSLLRWKKILFANINPSLKAYWKEENTEQDIVIGYNPKNDYYVFFYADGFRGKASTSLYCIRSHIGSDKIAAIKRNADGMIFVYVPCNQTEEFCRYFDFHMEKLCGK